jgi:hypothetical protein
VKSDKGASYILCGKSREDESFPKYPRLPVMSCRGYEEIDRPKKT